MNKSSVRMAEQVGHSSSDWDEAPLDLRHYVSILWRQRIAALLTVTLIIAAGGIYTYSQTPLYQSTAKVLLEPSAAESILNHDPDPSRGGKGESNQVQTEIEVMNSQPVQEAVDKALGELQPFPISTKRRGDTNVVSITATSKVPEQAARAAQTYAETYIAIRREQLFANLRGAINQVQAQIDPIRQQLTELERPVVELDARITATASEDYRKRIQDQRDGLIRQTQGQRALLRSREQEYEAQLDRLRLASSISNTGGTQLMDKAEVPNVPVSPNLSRNFVITLALSVLLGVVVALLRGHYDDIIKENDDLDQVKLESPFPRPDSSRGELEGPEGGEASLGDRAEVDSGRGVPHPAHRTPVRGARGIGRSDLDHQPESRREQNHGR